MLEPQDFLAAEPSAPPRPVLVVIADPQLRHSVGWILDDLGLARRAQLAARAVTTTDTRPAVLIGDFDDGGTNVAGVRAILRASWAPWRGCGSRSTSAC